MSKPSIKKAKRRQARKRRRRGQCYVVKETEEEKAERIAAEAAERRLDHGPLDDWLWCLHCERVFQRQHLRHDRDPIIGALIDAAVDPIIDVDDYGDWCPFCGAGGLGIDIRLWSYMRERDRDWLEHWPKTTAELSYGLECPIYPPKNAT